MKRIVAIFLALVVSCAAGLHVLNGAGELAGTGGMTCAAGTAVHGGFLSEPARGGSGVNGRPAIAQSSTARQSPAAVPEGSTAATQGRTTAVQGSVKALDAKGGALEHAVWGILAVNFKGDTIANLNKGKCMVPASNMKLVTTAAAYLKLGRNYRFTTTIATDGIIKDSTLCGNLYIIGGGDPLIGNLFSYLPNEDIPFGKWGKVLEEKGIRRIDGDIVGNGDYFGGERRHTDWSTEDERSKDGVVPAGLTWRGKMGDSIPDGPLAAATHFRRWLIANGVVVTGDAGSTVYSATATHGITPENKFSGGPDRPAQKTSVNGSPALPDSLTILGTAQSATLNHIAGIANHQSDNFCAETLLKAIGKADNGCDDYDSATEALHRALAPIGLAGPSAGMRFADGSGLSRKNYLSPEFLVSLLRGMARTSLYKDYLNSLPRPGQKNGTLATRLPKAPASVKNRIYMKSGSMNGVRCFSGYIIPSDGNTKNTIAFSVMVNNYVGRQAELAPVLDRLILELAKEN